MSTATLTKPRRKLSGAAAKPAEKALALQKTVVRREPTKADQSQQIIVTFELIGEEEAYAYLATMIANRGVSQAKVDRFAADMTDNNWRTTHQGLGINKQGNLFDGQHRLWAIIQSKTRQLMMVTRGLDEDVRDYIDLGSNRTAKDVLELKLGHKLRKVGPAIARILSESGMGDRRMPTRMEQVNSYFLHQEAIEAICTRLPKRVQKFSHVAVLTPLVRAWYNPDLRDKVFRFLDILITGHYEKGEEIVINFRNFLVLEPTLQGSLMFGEIYGKCEKALELFIADKPLQRLVPSKQELFPLPKQFGG